MTRKILAASLIITGLIALGLVGNQDYADAQAQAAYQCKMIEAGHWPADVNPSCMDGEGDGK